MVPKNISKLTFAQFLSAYTRIPKKNAATRFDIPYTGPVEAIYPREFSVYAASKITVPDQPIIVILRVCFFIMFKHIKSFYEKEGVCTVGGFLGT